jgi:hypothetical protein
MRMITTIIQLGTCCSALLAAWYWYKSAHVLITTTFGIAVPATYGIQIGKSRELDELAEALRVQSKFSSIAAMWAGLSGVLSAVAVILAVHLH